MNYVGLFILSASLLATLYAGKIELWVAAVVFFIAAAISDLLSILNKFMMARTVEVMVGNGLAQGNAPKGTRKQGRSGPRQEGEQTPLDPNGKAD